ncbi:hypothetical protein ACLOJK_026353 [Asimina triloba]
MVVLRDQPTPRAFYKGGKFDLPVGDYFPTSMHRLLQVDKPPLLVLSMACPQGLINSLGLIHHSIMGLIVGPDQLPGP